MSENGLRTLQAKSAAAARWDRPDKDDAARVYAEARLAAFIQRTLNSAPALTTEQRDRLALLFRGGDAA